MVCGLIPDNVLSQNITVMGIAILVRIPEAPSSIIGPDAGDGECDRQAICYT
jgi:hypothetical protein